MIRWKTLLTFLLIWMMIFTWYAPHSTFAKELGTTNHISVKLVKTLGNNTELAVELLGEFQIRENGQALASSSFSIRSEQNSLIISQGSNTIYRGTELTLIPKVYGKNTLIKVNRQPYLGEMRFVLENGIFVRPINTLPMEDYLKGVVPFEMPASWELEALKAQAIAARTYATRFLHQVIDDSVNYQVYNGYQWSKKSTQAVEETQGQVIQQNGTLIEALYSSSNGGMVEASESLWQAVAYLTSQEDPYDPQNKWSLSLHKEQLSLNGLDIYHPEKWWDTAKEKDSSVSQTIKAWLQQNGYENHTLKLVQISGLTLHPERTKGNRIKSGAISFDFLAKHPTNGYVRNPDGSIQLIHREFPNLPATALRSMLGGGNTFKSYLVDSVQKDAASYIITGRGFGHGVGMSQYGANEMAKKASKASDILAFYYPGTMVTEAVEMTPTTPIPTSPPVPMNDPIQVDTNPLLSSMKLSTATFTLGSKESVAIHYHLQKPAVVSIGVYDDKGKIRRVILNESNQSAGNKSTSWDGYGITEGIFTVVIEAKNESGMVSNVTSKIQFISTPSSRASVLDKQGMVSSKVIVGLRTQASFQSKSIKLLKNGDSVQILGKSGAWYKVKVGSHLGFVPENYIVVKK